MTVAFQSAPGIHSGILGTAGTHQTSSLAGAGVGERSAETMSNPYPSPFPQTSHHRDHHDGAAYEEVS
jgi:hypothetical protein